MKLPKIAAIGLAIALAGACDNDKKDAVAEGATNGTNAATTQTAAQDETAKAGESELPIEATGPVATINGEEITAAEFNVEVKRLNDMLGSQMPPGMLVNMKDQIVEQLVAKKLVEDAVKTGGVEVPDAEVDAEYAKFVKQLDEAAPGGAKGYLAQLGRTEAQMKDDVRRSLELKALMSKDHDFSVPDAEIKTFYDENKAQFDQAARVKASHILLKLEQDAPDEKVAEVKKRADEIAAKAKAAGADFAALARENSEGPTAPRGGDLGYFEKGKMVPEFDKVAWEMKVGSVSDPVRTQFGYHVIKLDDRRDAKSMGYDEAREMIEARLQEPKLKTAMKATVDSLKAKAKVELMANNIKTNVEPPQAPPGMGGMGGGMGGHPPMPAPHGQGGNRQKLKLDQLK